jgi:hypothetical protein
LIHSATKPTVSPWATIFRHSVAAKANMVFATAMLNRGNAEEKLGVKTGGERV